MQADWFFDFVSPFSYLQWPQILALKGRVEVTPRPILFGALLDHLGTVGPAEMPAKRRFTYRMALWQAQQAGRTMRFPPTHPFNPVPALRLCIAAGSTPEAITAIFDWIWCEGRAADSVDALKPLAEKLGIADIAAAISTAPVKQSLRDNYDLAVAKQVFGVPSIVIGDEVFWGNDSTPLFTAWLADPGVLHTPEMQRVVDLPITAQRAAVGPR